MKQVIFLQNFYQKIHYRNGCNEKLSYAFSGVENCENQLTYFKIEFFDKFFVENDSPVMKTNFIKNCLYLLFEMKNPPFFLKDISVLVIERVY